MGPVNRQIFTDVVDLFTLAAHHKGKGAADPWLKVNAYHLFITQVGAKHKAVDLARIKPSVETIAARR